MLSMYFCKRFTNPALQHRLLASHGRARVVVSKDEGATELFALSCPGYPPLKNKVWKEV